mgnify:CR=1 FL=1
MAIFMIEKNNICNTHESIQVYYIVMVDYERPISWLLLYTRENMV